MSAKPFLLWDHFDGIFLKRTRNQKTPDLPVFFRNSQKFPEPVFTGKLDIQDLQFEPEVTFGNKPGLAESEKKICNREVNFAV